MVLVTTFSPDPTFRRGYTPILKLISYSFSKRKCHCLASLELYTRPEGSGEHRLELEEGGWESHWCSGWGGRGVLSPFFRQEMNESSRVLSQGPFSGTLLARWMRGQRCVSVLQKHTSRCLQNNSAFSFDCGCDLFFSFDSITVHPLQTVLHFSKACKYFIALSLRTKAHFLYSNCSWETL